MLARVVVLYIDSCQCVTWTVMSPAGLLTGNTSRAASGLFTGQLITFSIFLFFKERNNKYNVSSTPGAMLVRTALVTSHGNTEADGNAFRVQKCYRCRPAILREDNSSYHQHQHHNYQRYYRPSLLATVTWWHVTGRSSRLCENAMSPSIKT